MLPFFLSNFIFTGTADLGVLISGGTDGREHLQSVEIYNPASNTTCSLNNLPVALLRHSQDGGLACGGYRRGNIERSCVKWSSDSGNWTQSHTLLQSRAHHVSWVTKYGVYLIGGSQNGNKKTTELVKEDGSVEDGFSLKYSTR